MSTQCFTLICFVSSLLLFFFFYFFCFIYILFILEEKSGKQNLFETKHKRIDKVVETLQEPKHIRKWTTKSMKGAFYFNETINSIISNSFALDLHVDTSVFITIETFQTNLHTSKQKNYFFLLCY